MPAPAQHPRVSVLLPCRNAAAWLRECIRSLQQQTYSDFEVIAVDDGSTDDTIQILEHWLMKDARVALVRTAGAGLVDALNAALVRARGEFIARMDADDIAEPGRFERQIELLEAQPEVAVCGTGVRYFPREIVRDGAIAYEVWINSLHAPEQLQRDLFVECPIAHPTLMARREVFQKVRGYRDEGWPEDYDLVLRIAEAGFALANVPKVLHQWRERDDRLSRTDPRYSADAFRRCKVHYLRRLRLQRRSVAVWGAGPVGKAFARELQEQRVMVRAFIDIDPKKIGQRPHDIPVVSPDALEQLRDSYIVAAVGQEAARTLIRAELERRGLLEPGQFTAVA